MKPRKDQNPGTSAASNQESILIRWIILAQIAIAVLGIAFYAIPVFLIAGTASLISGGRSL